MTYKIIKTSNLEDLENFVKFWVKKEWKPQGGICFDGSWYIQAMVLQ